MNICGIYVKVFIIFCRCQYSIYPASFLEYQQEVINMEETSTALQIYPNHFTIKREAENKLCGKYIQRQVQVFKDRHDYEGHIFWFNATEPNCLAFFYFRTEQFDKALYLNDEIQQKWPSNIMAKADRIAMLNEMKSNVEAKLQAVHLNKLKESEIFAKELSVAEVEMAYFYEDLGPHMYPEVKQSYEKELSIFLPGSALSMGALASQSLYDAITCSPELHQNNQMSTNELTWWFLNLAKVYNRMMNRGNMTYFPQGQRDIDLNTHMANIKDLLTFITDAEQANGNVLLTGRAYVELADAFKKYTLLSHKAHSMYKSQKLPDSMTVEDCMRKAVQITPDDAYVNERVGRHCRQVAYDKEDFNEAIMYLEKAVKLCPSRHVAWHHLGQAYKALWVIEMDFVQKFIYQNTRNQQGHGKSRSQNQSHGRGRGHSRGHGRGNKQVRGHHQNRGGNHGNTELYSQEFKLRDYNDHHQKEPTNRPDVPGAYTARQRSSVLDSEHHIITPKHINQPGAMACHDGINFFHILKSSNPIDIEMANPHPLLVKARDSFQRATKTVSDTAVIYLVDLARALVSMGRKKDAIIYLVKASKVESTIIDKQHLYEQFALIKHMDIDENTEEYLLQMEDVKRLYRESVEYAAMTKSASRIAYYKLDEQLENEIHTIERRNHKVTLYHEKAYLKAIVENFEEAMKDLEKGLDLDPDNKDCLWLMSKLCYMQGNVKQAWKHMEHALNMETSDTVLSDERKYQILNIVIDMTLGVLPDGQKRYMWTKILPFMYRKNKEKNPTYALSASMKAMDLDAESATAANSSVIEADMVLAATSSYDRDTEFAWSSLKQLGLDVFLYTLEGTCDIPMGEEQTGHILSVLSNDIPAVIHWNITSDSENNEFRLATAEIISTASVCCCIWGRGPIVPLPKEGLATIHISSYTDTNNIHNFTKDILETLFMGTT